MTETTLNDIQSMDFETAFTALQESVAALESEELPLEKALALYERGQKLAQHCAALLESAELKVQQLSMTASPDLTEED